jgi:hypothetical protein
MSRSWALRATLALLSKEFIEGTQAGKPEPVRPGADAKDVRLILPDGCRAGGRGYT